MKPNQFLATAISAVALVTSAYAQRGAPPDPQMKAVLDQLGKLGGEPIETLSPEAARKQPSPADAVKKLMEAQGKEGPEPVAHVEDKQVTLGDHKVPVRIYTPKGEGPFPVIFYIHGGGWVIADLDTYDASPRALANAAGAIVVSTHYRQAPEHPFPASHEDVFGTYQWVLKNEDKLNYDAKRIAIVGESAGGNMAAAVCMMAKEERIQMPVHQVLVYPVADLRGGETPSKAEYAEAKPLNTPMMEWFGKHLLAKPEDAQNTRLSLLIAGDELKGLPPTTIILAQIDPLRSEGESLAKALQDAGVKVNLKTYSGVAHEFFGMGAVVDKAKAAQQLAASDLRAALGK